MVAKSRHWIAGKSTTVVTDHEALQFLLASPELKSRLIRWKLALNQFDLTIIYRKGSLNVEGADALSRLPWPPITTTLEVPRQDVAKAAILSSFLPSEVCFQASEARDSSLFTPHSFREARALAIQLETIRKPKLHQWFPSNFATRSATQICCL